MVYLVLYGEHDPHFDFIDIPTSIYREKTMATVKAQELIKNSGLSTFEEVRPDHYCSSGSGGVCNFVKIISYDEFTPRYPVAYVSVKMYNECEESGFVEIIGLFNSQTKAKKAIIAHHNDVFGSNMILKNGEEYNTFVFTDESSKWSDFYKIVIVDVE